MVLRFPPEVITLTSAAGWWLELEEGGRQPLAAWCLVSDPQSSPFIVGAVVAEDGETVELAPVGRYVHEVGS